MYDPTPFTLIPAMGEPDHEARFREELAAERAASTSGEAKEPSLPADVDGLLARHFRRAAQFVPFA